MLAAENGDAPAQETLAIYLHSAGSMDETISYMSPLEFQMQAGLA